LQKSPFYFQKGLMPMDPLRALAAEVKAGSRARITRCDWACAECEAHR
jgi:hypothetical protein